MNKQLKLWVYLYLSRLKKYRKPCPEVIDSHKNDSDYSEIKYSGNNCKQHSAIYTCLGETIFDQHGWFCFQLENGCIKNRISMFFLGEIINESFILCVD